MSMSLMPTEALTHAPGVTAGYQTIIAGTFRPRTVSLNVTRRFQRMAEFTGEVGETPTPRPPRRTRESPSDGVYPIAHRKRCGEVSMSKGMDRKKETRKKAAKTFDEKRAAKREKRETKRR